MTMLASLWKGTLIALNRATGATVFRKTLPTTTNAPLAIFGNTVLVPAGGRRGLGQRSALLAVISSGRWY
jgi:hypothetical protein